MERSQSGSKNPLPGLSKTRRIGGTEYMELNKPPNLKLEVFADTETFYKTNGVEPWNLKGTKNYTAALREMDVIPFILVWKFRRIRWDGRYKKWVKCMQWTKRRVVIDDLDKLERLFDDLHDIWHVRGYTPVLYFHNAIYDIHVLEPMIRQADPTAIFYAYSQKRGKHFLKGSFASTKYTYYCELGDTLQYDKTMSIEKAGKMLEMEKANEDIPYGLCDVETRDGDVEHFYYRDLETGEERKFDWDRYLDYAERDVDIMARLHEKTKASKEELNAVMIDDWLNLTKNNRYRFDTQCTTRASHSKHHANNYLRSEGWGIIDTIFRFEIEDKKMYESIIASNCGGFTSFNKHITKYDCSSSKHIKYVDRNSMYPTIMTGFLPYGELLTEPPEDTYTTWYLVRFNACKWKGRLSCLANEAFSKDKVGPLIKGQGHPPIMVDEAYLRFVEENCDVDYEVKGVYYQRTRKLLRGLIHKYFDKRKEIKDRMKMLEKEERTWEARYLQLEDTQKGLKDLMNSLYGKLCEKGHHQGTVYFHSKSTTFAHETFKYPCILTGAYITYRARLCLLEKIKTVIEAGYDFLYADTDSVIYGCPSSDKPEMIFGEDRGRLGEWKEEGTFDLYLNNGKKKKYVLVNRSEKKYKMALSGIPKPVHKMVEHQMKTNFDRIVQDLIYIFSPDNNVLIKNCKRSCVLSNRWNQQIIFNTDFCMRDTKAKVTARMHIDEKNKDYKLEICSK